MEKKREAFKKYLDEKKVMNSLSKIIISLYEQGERPEDPLTFIRDCMAVDTGGIDILTVRQENAFLVKQLASDTARLAVLEQQLVLLSPQSERTSAWEFVE
jgi:hypothetical protein